jgi:uncharacterized OB-fold protein
MGECGIILAAGTITWVLRHALLVGSWCKSCRILTPPRRTSQHTFAEDLIEEGARTLQQHNVFGV